ncbi:hypothetical protein DV736_g818, partial [Chaetothyriales sp. CBS 134916]
MKILCLHGAYGSASNFQVQLSPVINSIKQRDPVDFKWIDGSHTAAPPKGFENYFGKPPLYRHFLYDGVSELDDMLTKLRDMQQGEVAEDTIRKLIGAQETFHGPAILSTIEGLLKIVNDDPEIDGILGYSEGAMAAATLILEERRQWELRGRERRLKFAIFFAGWPPLRIHDDGTVYTLLADQCDEVIDIPTCHIVGCNDPYVHGAMALYSVCDEDTAILFDHGKGHTVPRDTQTVQELTSAIRNTWQRRAQYG